MVQVHARQVSKRLNGEGMQFFQGALGPKNRARTFFKSVAPYREDSLNAIIQRASQIARRRRIRPRPAPLKFLARFVEAASLEERNSDLIDAWARLLVAAADKYDPVHNAYLNVLAQIGPDEVRLLQEFFAGGGVEIEPGKPKEEISRDLYNLKRVLRKLVADFLAPHLHLTADEYESLCQRLADVIALHYGAFARIVHTPAPGHQNIRPNMALLGKEGVIALLDNLGLVRLADLDYSADYLGDAPIPLGIHAEWVMLTEFGYNFVKTCQGAGKPPTERPLTKKGQEIVWRAQQPPEKTFEVSADESVDSVLKKLLSR
jgi:hypothetical protein